MKQISRLWISTVAVNLVNATLSCLSSSYRCRLRWGTSATLRRRCVQIGKDRSKNRSSRYSSAATGWCRHIEDAMQYAYSLMHGLRKILFIVSLNAFLLCLALPAHTNLWKMPDCYKTYMLCNRENMFKGGQGQLKWWFVNCSHLLLKQTKNCYNAASK